VYVDYALYFYFSGLSLRKAADRYYHSALSKETMFQSRMGFKNKTKEIIFKQNKN
jgi:hypothetical protein